MDKEKKRKFIIVILAIILTILSRQMEKLETMNKETDISKNIEFDGKFINKYEI